MSLRGVLDIADPEADFKEDVDVSPGVYRDSILPLFWNDDLGGTAELTSRQVNGLLGVTLPSQEGALDDGGGFWGDLDEL